MPKRPAASPLKVSRLLLAAVALFAVTRIYLLVFFEPPMSDVGEVYFAYAAGAIDFHQTPYQGELAIEYPPLGWWTIAAPRLIDPRRITDARNAEQIGPIFRLYRSTFRSLMFLCDLASFLLLLLVMQKRRPAWTGWAALTYVICTALLGPMLYDRLDTGLLFLFLAWAYCWIRSLDSTNPNSLRWAVAAYVAVGLGISFKLIPILSAPFLLLADGLAPGRLKRLAIVATALIAAAIGPFAIQYIVSGPALFSVFTYHSGRGIQIESLYASLMTLAAVFGLEISVNHAHGAYELDGALAPLLKMCSTVALVGFLLAAGLWALAQKSRFTRDDAYRLAAFVPAAAIILANVLSPQYFIWALPLLILVGAEILPE